jgi:hypothetical protein
MSLVEYYWRGNGPLWKIFWIYGVVVSVGLATLIATAAFQKWVGLPGLIGVLAGLIVYTIWVVVSIWRCADNIEGRPFGIDPALWSSLSRALTVAWVINALGLSSLLIEMTMLHPQ